MKPLRPFLAGMLYVPLSMIGAKRLSSIKKKLTFTETDFITGEEKRFSIYATDKRGYIGLPRAYGLSLFSGIDYKDCTVSGVDVTHRKVIKPRDSKQKDFIDGLIANACKAGPVDFIANAKTGSGKSVSSLAMAAAVGKPTLIIVPTNNLKKQWMKDTVAKFYGIKWAIRNLGEVQQNTVDFNKRIIVVASLSSIAKRDYGEKFYSYFGTVIFDEVHKCSAPFMSRALSLFPARVRLGVTATNRKGALAKVVRCHLGTPAVISKQEVLTPKIYLYRLEGKVSLFGASQSAILHSLALNSKRNKEIAKVVYVRGYKRNRNVVVLSDSVKQLQRLYDLFVNAGVPERELGLYVGRLYKKNPNGGFSKKTEKVQDEEYTRIKKEAKIIFATYGIFGTGIDIPRLDMGVEAMPRSDLVQAIGRIVRIYDGKPQPEWYSICDILEDAKTESGIRFAFICKRTKNRIRNFRRQGGIIVTVENKLYV